MAQVELALGNGRSVATPIKDDGIGWMVQLAASIGAILLATVGKDWLSSQSAITIPILLVVGVVGIVTALYARLKPAPKKKPPARRDSW